MPSPFPGMGPFLEDPAGWPNLHVNLITEIQAVLNRQLRPNYYARAEDRVYISNQDDPGRRVIAPYVCVLAREEQPPGPWVPLRRRRYTLGDHAHVQNVIPGCLSETPQTEPGGIRAAASGRRRRSRVPEARRGPDAGSPGRRL